MFETQPSRIFKSESIRRHIPQIIKKKFGIRTLVVSYGPRHAYDGIGIRVRDPKFSGSVKPRTVHLHCMV